MRGHLEDLIRPLRERNGVVSEGVKDFSEENGACLLLSSHVYQHGLQAEARFYRFYLERPRAAGSGELDERLKLQPLLRKVNRKGIFAKSKRSTVGYRQSDREVGGQCCQILLFQSHALWLHEAVQAGC